MALIQITMDDEDSQRDMAYAEAQEFGAIADDSADASIISDSVLETLGVDPAEVGQ